MNCVQLNCLAKPVQRPQRPPGRRHGHQPQQYAKVIDEGVLPVSNGLFVPGSPYYSTTKYPKYNPSQAAKLVKAAEKTERRARQLLATAPPTRRPPSGPPSTCEQAWQSVGFKVKTTIVQQNDTINDALAGKYEALGWRQFGAVDPDLNYIFWSTTTVSSGSLSINMARNADPARSSSALLPGRAEHRQERRARRPTRR